LNSTLDNIPGFTDAAPRFDGRVALITGASRGIGRAISLALAKGGAHTILLARTVGALEELDDEINEVGGSATLVPQDLKDFDALDQLGAAIYQKWKRLDIFVGNAGVLGPISPIGHIPPKDWQQLLDINVTANWRLIRSLDPLFRQSDAARLLFLTSSVARQSRAFWGGYAMSKAALETLVETYAAESEKTPMRVTLLNPGGTRTAMRASAMPGEDPTTLPGPGEIAELAMRLLHREWQLNGARIDFREWRAAQANPA